MLIVDIDKLFKDYAKEYLIKNKGKLSDDLDQSKEDLYNSFQNTSFASLDGLTPITFYANKKDKLTEILSEHFNKKVPVSEYLIDSLVEYGDVNKICALLDENNPEDLLLILLEVLNKKSVKVNDNRLIALLFSNKCDDCVKNSVIDYLDYNPIYLPEILLKCKNNDNVSGAVCEFLSKQKPQKEITDILVKGFLQNEDKIPEYCSYLVSYGEETVLPYLYSKINETEDYIDYKEIGLAIDALGGTFENSKDFSKDKNYVRIKEAGKNEHKD